MKKYLKLLTLVCLVVALTISCVACGAPNLEKLKTKLEENGLMAKVVEDVENDDLSLNMQAIFATQVPSYYGNENIVNALVACDLINPTRFALVVNFDDVDAAKEAEKFIEENNDSMVKRSGKTLFVASTNELLKTIS